MVICEECKYFPQIAESIKKSNTSRARRYCRYCRRVNLEKLVTDVIESISTAHLAGKKSEYSTLTDGIIGTCVGKITLMKDGFEISQVHLRIILDKILPGLKHELNDIPKYLRRSTLKGKYTRRRTTVTLYRNSYLANELGETREKSWIYLFKFEDMEAYKKLREVEDPDNPIEDDQPTVKLILNKAVGDS